MPYVDSLVALALVQLLAAASPGPTFLVVTKHTIGRSRGTGWVAAIGVLVATVIWVLLATVGLGAMAQSDLMLPRRRLAIALPPRL